MRPLLSSAGTTLVTVTQSSHAYDTCHRPEDPAACGLPDAYLSHGGKNPRSSRKGNPTLALAYGEPAFSRGSGDVWQLVRTDRLSVADS